MTSTPAVEHVPGVVLGSVPELVAAVGPRRPILMTDAFLVATPAVSEIIGVLDCEVVELPVGEQPGLANALGHGDCVGCRPRGVGGGKAGDLGVYWMEEPLHRGDHAGMSELRKRASVLIAGGEMTREIHEFDLMLSAGSLDVFQPGAIVTGGLTALAGLARRSPPPGTSSRRTPGGVAWPFSPTST